MKKFYSPGKLMITGEYTVLSGATSLALPCKLGQHLQVEHIQDTVHHWKSESVEGKLWFKATFSCDNLTLVDTSDIDRAIFISHLLQVIHKLNPDIFLDSSYEFHAKLEFDKDWGLGSSSTLINNLAEWADIDPFILLENTLGGSGYDIAVAKENVAILYKKLPEVSYHEVTFNPRYSDSIFFVYLNKKEDSAEAVRAFLAEDKDIEKELQEITSISESVLNCQALSDFESLMKRHNDIMSKLLNRESASERFGDYKGGVIKYLGAWGGDFMMATGTIQDMNYFSERGFKIILSYSEIIKAG